MYYTFFLKSMKEMILLKYLKILINLENNFVESLK